MNEQLVENQMILRKFKEMHVENSKEYKGRYELLAPSEVKREHNEIFQKAKKLIMCTLEVEKKLVNENSFITYISKSFIFTVGNPGRENLSLQKYLDILKKSDNYLKYLDILKKSSSLNSDYSTCFTLDNFNQFCSSILANFL